MMTLIALYSAGGPLWSRFHFEKSENYIVWCWASPAKRHYQIRCSRRLGLAGDDERKHSQHSQLEAIGELQISSCRMLVSQMKGICIRKAHEYTAYCSANSIRST